MPDVPMLSGRRVAALIATAALLHGLFDAVAYRIHAIRPPYLRLEDAPEAFQMLTPVAVSIAVSCISGIIAAIAVLATPPPHRRTVVLGAAVTGFWLFSAVLLSLLWLSTHWLTTLTALSFGIPRGLAIGWCLALLATPRLEPRAHDASP